jgi:DNA-binding NarL/FixJ family response regulator
MTFDRTAYLGLAIAAPDDRFRMALQRYLRQYTQWPVILETADFAALVDLLVEQQAVGALPDLLILGWTAAAVPQAPQVWLRSLKQAFPLLPILLLADVADPIVPVAWWLGIEGACERSVGPTELLEVIWAVGSGQTAWATPLKAVAVGQSGQTTTALARSAPTPAWMQIDRALAAIDQKLRSPQPNVIERWVLQGRQRELRASRWITQRLLPGVPPLAAAPPAARPHTGDGISQVPPAASVGGLPWATLGDRFAAKLRYPLTNRTDIPLEIDILRPDKQRELLYVVLRQFEAIVDELRFSQVPLVRLEDTVRSVLVDLWQAVLPEFFGKYYQVAVQGTEVSVVASLRQQQGRVETGILSRIPLVAELLAYLLWQAPLMVDNQQYPAASPVAIAQGGAILENLVIQVANATIAPLLNQFADVEPIKQAFYDRQRLSTREIERFRNDLSWRDRRDRYVGDPLAMFESQYPLFVLTEVGIDRQVVYAPRRQELEELRGIPLVVTLLWEVRDAVAPRLRMATALVGSGLVYVLTEVIGRGLGLVGRGIVKGIGNAFQDRA